MPETLLRRRPGAISQRGVARSRAMRFSILGKQSLVRSEDRTQAVQSSDSLPPSPGPRSIDLATLQQHLVSACDNSPEERRSPWRVGLRGMEQAAVHHSLSLSGMI